MNKIVESLKNKPVAIFIAVLILLSGIIIRSTNLNVSWEYDELWSADYYSILPIQQIFSDFTFPNNHPLNTLVLKFLFQEDNSSLARVLPFLLSIGSIVLAGLICYQISGTVAALIVILLCAISPQLVRYSCACRGYSGQIFFILLFLLLQLKTEEKKSIFGEIGLFISGVLAVNCIFSSLLFLLFPTIYGIAGYLYYRNKNHPRHLNWGLIFFAVYAICHYMLSREAWLRTSAFAGIFANMSARINYLSNLLINSCLLPGIMAVFFLRPLHRLVFWSGTFLLPLIISLFTYELPQRAWLPLTIISLIIIAAAAMTESKKNYLQHVYFYGTIFLVFILFALAARNPEWRITHYKKQFDELIQTDNEILITCAANESYPVARNNKNKAEIDFFNRIMSDSKRLLIIGNAGQLNGQDKEFAVKDIIITPKGIPVVGKFFSGICYDLVPQIDVPEKGEWLLIKLKPVEEKQYKLFIHNIIQCHPELLKINPWLTRILTKDGKLVYYGLFAIKSNDYTASVVTELPKVLPQAQIYRLANTAN